MTEDAANSRGFRQGGAATEAAVCAVGLEIAPPFLQENNHYLANSKDNDSATRVCPVQAGLPGERYAYVRLGARP